MYTLIDGDVIVYSCGFASEKNQYTVGGRTFQYKKDANKYADQKAIMRETITKEIFPEPVENALHNVKQTLLSIAENCDSHEGKIYLSGKTNFRDKVAISHPYKGTRDPNHKPIHYQAIKDYLTTHWKAEVVEGVEADDALGIYQTNTEGTVICSIDKDLRMIPGRHYNIRTEVLDTVSEEEAGYFFHKQMLTGDRVDNIIGIKGIGDKRADKLLRGKNWAGRRNVIKRKYISEFGLADAQARYAENKQLLWILREPLEETYDEG